MKKGLFKEGGPLGVKNLGNDQYRLSITIPKDQDGRIARECPNSECSPAYFKVTPGTGITDGQESAFCPYCRHAAEPTDFTTQEQIRYAQDMAIREAHGGIDEMVKDALGDTVALGAAGDIRQLAAILCGRGPRRLSRARGADCRHAGQQTSVLRINP
ncbi:MAG: hypothetical protein P8090_19680 [Gammaproteobacteria bacterium]